MVMSNSYHIAIEEGANVVRIGTMLFLVDGHDVPFILVPAISN